MGQFGKTCWVLVGAVGCAGSGIEAPAPVPSPAMAWPSPDSLVLADSVLHLADDSAADRAALDALAELEFGSLDGRAGHVRGLVSTEPTIGTGDVADESTRLFGTPRGGVAAAAGPTYDIDVESFSNHGRVQYYVDFFLGPARDRFAIWLTRLPRYDGMIRARLRQHGVPEDLVYLALIESGYSNTAVSHARAVGMWQFVVSTGRQYGLRQDTWVDERRDPFLATDAAARHLADLNQQFGSWYLAAAAYNAGAGRVERGLRRLPNASDTPSDATFFELSKNSRYLKLETRDYVPKLIAAALIAKEPSRYGFDSVVSLAPLTFDEVRIPDATSLDVLARLADTAARALADLNPHFFRGVTPPGREVVVRVPRGTGPEVVRRWANLLPSERVSFVEHAVTRGETLSGIAQRYGIATSLLMAANPGVSPKRLRIGQRLTVPLSHAARRGALAGSAPRAAAAPVRSRTAFHTVRAGESLWALGRRYGVRVVDLRTWNGMEQEDVLRAGRRLRVAAP
jgi:membrane-bound lytic murein transglycosylase D